MKAQIDSLTTLRGGLALWVVVYHYWNDVVRLFPAADALSPIARLGHMAVPAFFMLSGFVLTHNYADRFAGGSLAGVWTFWKLRLARIYPVHLATLLAVAVMVEVGTRLGMPPGGEGYTTREFVLNLFLVHTWVPDFRLNWNYPSWSISSEWFAYLAFPLAAAWLLHRLRSAARAAAFAAVCLTGTVVLMTWWAGKPFYELVLVVPTFFAGTAACLFVTASPGGGGRIERGAADALLAGLAACCFIPFPDLAVAGLAVVCFALIVALARAGDRPRGYWITKPATYLGEVSYSLYMTHTLAQKVAYKLLPAASFAESHWGVKAGVLAAYAGLVAACCLGSYYLIERPARTWARRLIRPTTQPAPPVPTPSP